MTTQLAFIAASSLLSVWCVTALRGFTSHTDLLVACSFYISEISSDQKLDIVVLLFTLSLLEAFVVYLDDVVILEPGW